MSSAIAKLFNHSNRRVALDVEEELHFHIEMLERKYAEHGMSSAEAKAAAIARFGHFETVKQECVDISKRNSLLRQVLKRSTILLGLIGLVVHVLSADKNIAHVGDTLIMIAIAGRLFLFVRGLNPSTFLPRTKASPSITREP